MGQEFNFGKEVTFKSILIPILLYHMSIPLSTKIFKEVHDTLNGKVIDGTFDSLNDFIKEYEEE